MTTKLEDKLIYGGIVSRTQLSKAEQAELDASPALSALLAETSALAGRREPDCPPPPTRERLLGTVFAASNNTSKETNMTPNLISRLFAGKHPAARFALGGVFVVALIALSLALPRSFTQGPAQPAWAAAEGYLLAFDFGDADQATIQPIVDQLKAKVTAFKQAHNLPIVKQHSASGMIASDRKMIIKHEESGQTAGAPQEKEQKRAIVMVSLPDATLVDDLKKELASIPGLPTPELTDATWFTEKGLPDPTQPGINLSLNFGDKQHVFNFPETATEQQIQSEIDSWLKTNQPDFQNTVKVTLTGTAENRQIEVSIESKKDDSSAGTAAAPDPQAGPAPR